MAKKLYVGNLPYTVNSDELRDMFSAAGSSMTSADVLIDKMTGRSRGFGFVEFGDDAEAENAISMFNDKEVGGRKLVVNESRPREEGRSFGGGNRRMGGGGMNRGGFGGGNRGGDRGGRW